MKYFFRLVAPGKRRQEPGQREKTDDVPQQTEVARDNESPTEANEGNEELRVWIDFPDVTNEIIN